MYIDGRCIDRRDCSDPDGARAVLLNPVVTAAVLETSHEGIVREGRGYDQCDVAVVTDMVHGYHLGNRELEGLEESARVKRVVVEAVPATGVAVLNADDALVRDMARYCKGEVLFFSSDGDPEAIERLRSSGRRMLLVREETIVLAQGRKQTPILPLGRIPAPRGVPVPVENVLAAVGAAIAIGLPLEGIRSAIQTFQGNTEPTNLTPQMQC
jgi:cyanophycin synthetase